MERLWAPWRLEYVQSADKADGCIFCRAAEGDDEEHLVVHRGEQAFVLLNKFPYSSGHLMIAPARHTGDFASLDRDEAGEIHSLAASAIPLRRPLPRPRSANPSMAMTELIVIQRPYRSWPR